MKLLPIVFISAALGSTLANTIQLPNLPDGTYLISIGEDGKPTWDEITRNATDAPAPVIPRRDTTSNSARLGKRFNWPSGTYPWCPGGDWFLQNDFYDHGFNAFYDMCRDGGNHKYPQNTVITQYQGTSVTYMCAYTTNPCRPDEWADAVNWAASNCHGRSNGWMEPGMFGRMTLVMTVELTTLNTGYLHVPGWNKVRSPPSFVNFPKFKKLTVPIEIRLC